MHDYMRRHTYNLKKSAGLIGNGMVKYEHILTKDQLFDAYLKKMNDLSYPLRVEPKRDRYVMNSVALKKAFEDATTQALKQIEDELHTIRGMFSFVEKEVLKMVEEEVSALLNTITFTNGQCQMKTRPIKKVNWASRLGSLLGKELIKTTAKIFEDTVNPKRTRRR